MTILLDRPLLCPVLLGRAAHDAALRESLQQVQNGSGQTVLIAGEAGVGKSRLVAEAKTHAADRGFVLLQGACFQADSASPYAPLLDLLRTHFANGWDAAMTAALGPLVGSLGPLLPDLLPQPVDQPPRPSLDLGQEKQQRIAAFTQFFLRQSAEQPLLVVVEDLHWSDDSSLECLYHLARKCSQSSLLLLLTYRNDEVHPRLRHWLAQLDRGRLAQELTLPCLSRSDVVEETSDHFVFRHALTRQAILQCQVAPSTRQ